MVSPFPPAPFFSFFSCRPDTFRRGLGFSSFSSSPVTSSQAPFFFFSHDSSVPLGFSSSGKGVPHGAPSPRFFLLRPNWCPFRIFHGRSGHLIPVPARSLTPNAAFWLSGTLDGIPNHKSQCTPNLPLPTFVSDPGSSPPCHAYKRPVISSLRP